MPSEANPLLPKHRLELIFQLTCLLNLSSIILDYSHLPPSARESTFTASNYTQVSSSTASSSDPSVSRSSAASATAPRSPPLLAPKPPASGSSADSTSITALSQPKMATQSSESIPSATATAVPSPRDASQAFGTKIDESTTGSPSALDDYLSEILSTIEKLDLLTQPSNNVMWQIQINNHSEAHSRRIWKAASYAWVLKHVGWNVQSEIKAWLLKFMTGANVDKEKRLKLDPFHFSYAA